MEEKESNGVFVEFRLGKKKPAIVVFDALVSRNASRNCVWTERRLQKKDVESFMPRRREGLAFLKGKWVEVNHKKLRELLKRMDGMDTSITLREALQMEIGNGKKVSADVGALVTNGAVALPKCCATCENHAGIFFISGSGAENRSWRRFRHCRKRMVIHG